MQLFNTMHPGGATMTSTLTYFPLNTLKISKKVLLPLQSQASDQSFRHKKYLRISLRFGETSIQSFKVVSISFFWINGPPI